MKNLMNINLPKLTNFKAMTIMMVMCFFQVNCFASDLHISAKPGGIYNLPAELNDTHIIIDGNGASGSPFTVNGAGGMTNMHGDSWILMTGNYITVQNVSFVNNVISYRDNEALIQMGTKKRNVTGDAVRNCSFDYNTKFDDRDKETQFYWIEITGKTNTVDNCTFQGKQNRLPTVHVNSHSWVGEGNTITNCTFQNVKPRKGEALEAIRVGLGNSRSNCRIINNKFINYAGDSETISCKSNGVVIEANTFTGCRSGVSLRLGDSCIIRGNKFVNTLWPVRLCGVGSEISENIFDSPASSAITFMKGKPAIYKTVDNVHISNNVFFGKVQFKILETKQSSDLPSNVTMADNYLYNNGSLFKIDDNLDAAGMLHKNSAKVNVRSDSVKEFIYDIDKVQPSTDTKKMDVVRKYREAKSAK